MSKDKRFVLSDGSTVNSKGYRIDINGLDMKRFMSNPIMLYEHNSERVIGRWTDIKKEEQRLTAVPEFDTEDSEVLSIAGKVERGFLNGASIGIIVLDIQNIAGTDVVTKSELYEASIVAVPADAGAVRLYNEQLECLTIDKLKLSINQQKQSKMDYKECFKEITTVLGINPESDTKTVLETIKKLTRLTGEAEIEEALNLNILTVAEHHHYTKMLRGGQSNVLQIIAEKKQDFLKKQDNELLDLYKSNYDKIVTSLSAEGWNEVKRLGYESAKKAVSYLPERMVFSGMIKNGDKGHNLEWYRKNSPQVLQNNPELYEGLLKEYKKDKKNINH